jgi:hypothetical protein
VAHGRSVPWHSPPFVNTLFVPPYCIMLMHLVPSILVSKTFNLKFTREAREEYCCYYRQLPKTGLPKRPRTAEALGVTHGPSHYSLRVLTISHQSSSLIISRCSMILHLSSSMSSSKGSSPFQALISHSVPFRASPRSYTPDIFSIVQTIRRCAALSSRRYSLIFVKASSVLRCRI